MSFSYRQPTDLKYSIHKFDDSRNDRYVRYSKSQKLLDKFTPENESYLGTSRK